MAGDEPQGERAFKVEDRRRFSETGDARTDVSGDEQRPEQEPAAAREGKGEPPPETGAPPAEITFASFILGLSTQALALLGEIQHPEQGGVQPDLAAARQIIDIMGLLQDKTRGNLDEAESALLESALYDLRMIFVRRSRNR